MLELVLIYCMIGMPDRCIERREVMDDVSDGIQCMKHGETEAARYVAAHPKWQLVTWRCVPSSEVQDPA